MSQEEERELVVKSVHRIEKLVALHTPVQARFLLWNAVFDYDREVYVENTGYLVNIVYDILDRDVPISFWIRQSIAIVANRNPNTIAVFVKYVEEQLKND